MKATFRIVLLACVWMQAGLALAIECPTPPNRVSAQVIPAVQFDNAAGQYRYHYTVTSLSGSQQEVDRFGVDIVSPVADTASPTGWYGAPYAYRATLVWSAVQVADPDAIPEGAAVPPSIVQIKPGQTLSGFGFTSTNPPGPTRYYVTGFAPVPVQTGTDLADAELQGERLLEQCPDLRKKILDLAVTAITVGPVVADFTPVEIDIKPGSDPNPVNPTAKGNIPVALLGSATLDVQQIDSQTITFGPSQARPAHTNMHFEDINGDTRLDAVYHFPTPETGLQCHETVAFLSGRLVTGGKIQGFDTIKTVSCKS